MTSSLLFLVGYCFDVDLVEGRFYWKRPSKYHNDLIGKEAGNAQPTCSGKEYWVIQINGQKYKRGRLIFLFITGREATPCIDHINGNSLDDRPDNLREATITQNAWNHKHRKRRISLPMGVRYTCSGRFEARISFHNNQLHLGTFDTADEARDVYQQKRKELYGDFA